MNPDPAEGAGPAGSARLIAIRVLQLLTTRVELLAVELQEERRWLVSVLLLLAVSLLAGLVGMLFLLGALVLALPADWRAAGAGGLGFILAAAGVGILLRLRRRLRDRPSPFSATVAELKRDREWIQHLE